MGFSGRSALLLAEDKLVTDLLRLVAALTFSVLVWDAPHVAWAAGRIPSAEDWPQFRGPTSEGVSLATNVPLTWSPTQNVKWKRPVPGRGRSSPVLLGDRIWLTTALETNIRTFAAGPDRMQQAERVVIGVVCLDRATGKQLYHTELFPVDNPPAVNFLNSYSWPWAGQLARSLQEPPGPHAGRKRSAVYHRPGQTDRRNRLEDRPSSAQDARPGILKVLFHAVGVRSSRAGADGRAGRSVVCVVRTGDGQGDLARG